MDVIQYYALTGAFEIGEVFREIIGDGGLGYAFHDRVCVNVERVVATYGVASRVDYTRKEADSQRVLLYERVN